MSKLIALGNEVIEFPDTMSDSDIEKALQAQSRPESDIYEKNIKPWLKPTIEGAGGIMGAAAGLPLGPVAAVGGGGLGFAAAKRLYETAERAFKGEKQRPLSESLPEAGKDIVTGAAMEAGGRAAGPILKIAGEGAKYGASALTGVPKWAIDAYANEATRKAVGILESQGVLSSLGKLKNKITGQSETALTKEGQRLAKAIEDAGGIVDIKSVREPFDNLLKEYEGIIKNDPRGIYNKEYAKLKNIYDGYFGGQTQVGVKLTPKVQEIPAGKQDFFNEWGAVEKPAYTKTNIASKPIFTPGAKTQISPTEAWGLQRRLNNLASWEAPQTGAPIDVQGIKRAAREGSTAINGLLDKATKGLSSESKGNYKTLLEVKDDLESLFGSEEKTFRTLSNLNNPAQKVTREKVARIQELLPELDILNQGDIYGASKYFTNPSLNPYSDRSTSTTRTATGALLGSLFGGPVGTAVGILMTSPLALKKAIQIGAPAVKAAAPTGSQLLRISPYVIPRGEQP